MGGVALAQMQGWVSEWAVGDSVDCSPVGGGPPGTFSWPPCHTTQEVQMTPWFGLGLAHCPFPFYPCLNSVPGVFFITASEATQIYLDFYGRKLGTGKGSLVLSIPESHWLLFQIGPLLSRALRSRRGTALRNKSPLFLIFKGEVQCDKDLQNQ